eukprot:scaffold1744_cov252-Pinguiococcus_pyrenoidosus.AAC.13
MAPLEGRLVDALGVVQSSRRLHHPLGQDFVKGFIFVQCLELLRKSLRQPGEHRPASAHDDVMPDVSPHVRLALCDDLQYQSRQIPALQRPIFRCREVRHLCWQSACAARHVEKDVPCGVRRRLKLCGIGVPTNADACPPGRILGDFLRHLEPLCRQGLPERVAQRASPHGTNGERMLDDLPVIHRDGAGICSTSAAKALEQFFILSLSVSLSVSLNTLSILSKYSPNTLSKCSQKRNSPLQPMSSTKPAVQPVVQSATAGEGQICSTAPLLLHARS